MSFRDEDIKYKALKDSWLKGINKAHHPGKGIVIAEVDNLMLASYRLMQCLRSYLSKKNVDVIGKMDTRIKVPQLPEALRNAREAVGQTNGIVALYFEAEKLEALSRSAYRWLKDNHKLCPVTKADTEQSDLFWR